jgi:hypothetical protein
MVSHLPRTSSGPTFPPACQGTPLDSGADISERVREPAGRSAARFGIDLAATLENEDMRLALWVADEGVFPGGAAVAQKTMSPT